MLAAIAFTLGLVFVACFPHVEAVGGQQRIAYYGNWDIYSNDYTLKKVNGSGAASQLTNQQQRCLG